MQIADQRSLTDVPRYVRASTAEGLTRLMEKNNISRGKWYVYTIIHANGFWYAWFYEDDRKRNFLTKDNDNGIEA